jgi:hypothetical protein
MRIKTKQQHGKNVNIYTDLFLNYMDFFAVRTKINKKKKCHFFFCYAWALKIPFEHTQTLINSKKNGEENLKLTKFRRRPSLKNHT